MTEPREILHYTGYDDDRGGIVSVVHNLAGTGDFRVVLGVNAGARQGRVPPLPVCELPRIAGEQIGPATFWRARTVARAVAIWLAGDPARVFHGHSRAGLLVGLWLHGCGERRVVVSVHCYGRQRWFYRWAARQLGDRLFWLSPAMKRHYGAGDETWRQCIPGGVPPALATVPVAGSSGCLRLGGVGALVGWKGWATVIEALARLAPEQRTRVTFEHIGAGDDAQAEALRRLAAAKGLAEQVKFCGAEASSARLLGAVDALVVASVNEPLSLAMLEALAAGVPVIAADSGGAGDVIRAGENGRMFRTGDAGALQTLLADWLDHPPRFDADRIRATTIPVARVAAQWAEVYAGL